MPIGWIIGLLAAVPFVLVATYTDRREKQARREILLHGESAIGTVVDMKGISGGRRCWDVTIEFQAKDHPTPTRIEVRLFVRPQMASWGDWQSLLGRPWPPDDFQVGQSVPLHYPKQWPGLAVIDALPDALRVK